MDLYRNCLLNKQNHNEKQNGFVSDKHIVYTQTTNKLALSFNDDKVFIDDNNIDTFNIGHYKTLKK